MSKKNAAKKNEPAPSTDRDDDGYTTLKERTELAGYWVPEKGPIHGKLIEAFQFVQRTGKGRGLTQTVFVFDLLEPCVARVKLDGGGFDEDTLEARSLVGVISTYGLRGLITLGGCFVKIERLGKRTLGNGKESWSYNIKHKPVRGRTLDVRAPFAREESHGSNGAREPGEDGVSADDLPF